MSLIIARRIATGAIPISPPLSPVAAPQSPTPWQWRER